MNQQTPELQNRIFGFNLKNTIPFINIRWITFSISSIIIVAGIVMFIMKGGFNLGIDFKGGVKLETKFSDPAVTIQNVRKAFSDVNMEADINTIGNANDRSFMITLPILPGSAGDEVEETTRFLKQKFGQDHVEIKGSEKVDAKIGKDFANRAVNLMLIAAGLILLYVIFRFDFFYGTGAVISIFHDMMIVLSFAIFFNIPIDITVIAALLTVLGYSINDTIVVYDRIREMHKLSPEEDYKLVINRSITQTLNRTIVTSLTTMFVVMAIYIWGGIVLKNFAFLLMVGIIEGTYSSIFIAAPITYMLRKRFDKRLKKPVPAVK